ncbi:MAG: hypothetical protein ACXVMS_12205 [Flavisolibacter sp.]
MNKKTVNVSEQLLTSILIGFALALIVVGIGHLSPKNWKAMPIMSGNSYAIPLSTPVGACGYECMFGERHGADCSGKDISNFGSTNLSIGEIISASFEHLSTILIIGLIASAVIYLLRRVSFQVTKE